MKAKPALFVATVALAVASCSAADSPAARGEALVNDLGCVTCHVAGGNALGPSWEGIAGSERTFADGTTALADEAYLRESIVDPWARIVEGWRPAMPLFSLETQEVEDIVAYLQTLGSDAAPAIPSIAADEGRRVMNP